MTYDITVSFDLGPALHLGDVQITAAQPRIAAAQARIATVLDLAGASDIRVSDTSRHAAAGPTDLRLHFDWGTLDIDLLPEPPKGATILDLSGATGRQNAFAIVDPSAILEADLLADQPGLDLRQLTWDRDPDINALAPYLVRFEAGSRLDTQLLARTADSMTGHWDRQSPFVIQSDLSLPHMARALTPWLRPASAQLAGKPFLRLWEGATLLALMLSGTLKGFAPGDTFLVGIGPPDNRQMLKLAPSAAPGHLPDRFAAISEAAQSALTAAQRASRHRRQADALLSPGDPFPAVLALVKHTHGLATQGSLTDGAFEPLLAQLSYDFGWGVMYDAQYPALQQLLNRADRLTPVHVRGLLTEWRDHIIARTGPPSADREAQRLRTCKAILDAGHTPDDISPDDLAAIDPLKRNLHSDADWRHILRQWQAHFAPMAKDPFDTNTLCRLAFCTGQHLIHDPLRRSRVLEVFGHPLPTRPEPSHG